jgi:hypothetical protein
MDELDMPGYMTVVEGRRPKKKLHTTFGHALNALQQPVKRGTASARGQSGRYVDVPGQKYQRYVYAVCGGKMYTWDSNDNAWALVYDVEPGTYGDELPWREA